MPVLAAVPVKRFFVAKQRLSPVLPRQARSRLGRDLASHTLETVEKAGARPLVLAADGEVADWAARDGWEAVVDGPGGLNAAAGAACERAVTAAQPWLIVHADLPLLTAGEVGSAISSLLSGRSPIAPTDDGGTSLLGGHAPFDFTYGPGSFHRHLARSRDPEVLVRLGLAIDLDHPDDFAAALSHPRGRWLSGYAAPR